MRSNVKEPCKCGVPGCTSTGPDHVAQQDYDLPNTNEIRMYCHCGLCLKEKPKHVSPGEWSSLEVGFTKQGLQVWCKRHNVNVFHIDFEGHTHPANSTAT